MLALLSGQIIGCHYTPSLSVGDWNKYSQGANGCI